MFGITRKFLVSISKKDYFLNQNKERSYLASTQIVIVFEQTKPS